MSIELWDVPRETWRVRNESDAGVILKGLLNTARRRFPQARLSVKRTAENGLDGLALRVYPEGVHLPVEVRSIFVDPHLFVATAQTIPADYTPLPLPEFRQTQESRL